MNRRCIIHRMTRLYGRGVKSITIPQAQDGTTPQGGVAEGLGPVTVLDDGWLGFDLSDFGSVEVALADIDGAPEIVGLRLDIDPRFYAVEDRQVADLPASERRRWALDRRAAQGQSTRGLNNAVLRRLPMEALRRAAAAYVAGQSPWDELGREVANPRGKRLPEQHFEQVAQVYRRALALGKPPLRAVEQAFHVSRPGASKYVRQARERGLLGYPTRRGVPGADAATSPIRKRAQRAGLTMKRRAGAA